MNPTAGDMIKEIEHHETGEDMSSNYPGGCSILDHILSRSRRRWRVLDGEFTLKFM